MIMSMKSILCGKTVLKQILSLLLCLICVIPAAVPVTAAGSTVFSVTADKSIVQAGDTVSYSVNIDAVDDLYGLKLKVNLPAGLMLIEGTGEVPEDLGTQMNAAKVEFVENTGVFVVGACQYSSATSTELFRFQCIVADDAPDSMEVYLEIDPENVFDSEYRNIPYVITTATIQKREDCDHEWSEVEAGEDSGHWYDCQLCDMSKIEAHVDMDDDYICDVCGYGSAPRKKFPAMPLIGALLILAAAAVFLLRMRKK